MKNMDIADFTNHLEDFEKMIAAAHIYECEECELIFAVDQNFDQHCDLVCPFCRDDHHIRYHGCGKNKGG
ncbi:hypothetical protein GFC29_3850 (plasmid) [Anoxybacillus sp. B7M1]|uniref:hypothetical protein n=1 Tax=Anoxybacillus sp. B7M1 TaxID=1490057 RepID=UPI0005CD8DFA|nr:hypothetical protein [Anoxybacillus sp. B7M1]ANB66120.1 hypothetical protein GFC29_3850 [Anoxybacillus sp. B7M1]